MLLAGALSQAIGTDDSDVIARLEKRANEPAMGFMLNEGAPLLLSVTAAKQYAYLVAIRWFFRQLPTNTLKAIPSGASDET